MAFGMVIELPITVYGDDLATPNKDGYTVGEPYYFKVWDNTAKDYYYAEATILLRTR
jgi:hypothetical protein